MNFLIHISQLIIFNELGLIMHIDSCKFSFIHTTEDGLIKNNRFCQDRYSYNFG